MNESAKLVKTALAEELAKEGMTLSDLEEHLRGNLNKTAGGAADMAWWTTNIPNALKSVLNIYGTSLAATGALAGTGLYAAHLMNEDSTNAKIKKDKERDQYMDASKTLQDKMTHPNVL